LVKRYFCDICGKEIPSRCAVRIQVFYIVKDKNGKNKFIPLKSLTLKEDYCKECAEKKAKELIKKLL